MKLREVASGLQFPEGPVAMADGSVLVVEIARGTLSRVTPDGRIHVVADLGGGPNGAAIGPDGAVYVCNNGGFSWVKTVSIRSSSRLICAFRRIGKGRPSPVSSSSSRARFFRSRTVASATLFANSSADLPCT